MKTLVFGIGLFAMGCGPAPTPYCEITYVVDSGAIQHLDTQTQFCFVTVAPVDHATSIQVGPIKLVVPEYQKDPFPDGLGHAEVPDVMGDIPLKGQWGHNFPAFELNFGGRVAGFVRGYVDLPK